MAVKPASKMKSVKKNKKGSVSGKSETKQKAKKKDVKRKNARKTLLKKIKKQKVAKKTVAKQSASRQKSPKKVAEKVRKKQTAVKQKNLDQSGAQKKSKKTTKKQKPAKKINKKDLKELISKGKKQGYLTYDEINEYIPDDLLSSDQIDETLMVFDDLDIEILSEEKSKLKEKLFFKVRISSSNLR